MANASKREHATPRRDKWHEIEGRIFGQCIWQQIGRSRRIMWEGLLHKRTGRIMIVEKTFNTDLPGDEGRRRPYPELSGIVVYDQVAPELSDWDEFERALEHVA